MFTLAGSYSRKSGACRDGPRSISTDLIEVYKKVYKIIHGFPSFSFDTFFQFSYNFNTSKHSLKLHKRRDRTDLRQHFFTERVINTWNSLDEQSVSAVSVNSFNGKLQKLHTDG